jgi:hypothetical protein
MTVKTRYELDRTYSGKGDAKVAVLDCEPTDAEMDELRAQGYSGFEWTNKTAPPSLYAGVTAETERPLSRLGNALAWGVSLLIALGVLWLMW